MTSTPRLATIGRGSLFMMCARRARQLDAVAVHHERDRRAMEAGGDQAVQRLAGNPAGIAGSGR